uniref:helix-turn-helix transcriptional regulator n=1 Tax=uncultured Altererythrobacter sp. TaxID=500840 RepID=UPI00260BFE9E|nr:helix-turn-helix transcriptional regulator [uncultured Altererythrobacter sp.]
MLSELEGAVLSVIARKQPLTAYAVRKEFEASATHSWSASAGAIYPLVRRLVKGGLIKETPDAEDARGTRKLELTRDGNQALCNWVLETRVHVLAAGPDPIRTRSFALSAVPPQLRVKALQDWRKATIERLEATIEQIARFEADGDILAAMATRGGELEERARIQWIDEMIERMSAR